MIKTFSLHPKLYILLFPQNMINYDTKCETRIKILFSVLVPTLFYLVFGFVINPNDVYKIRRYHKFRKETTFYFSIHLLCFAGHLLFRLICTWGSIIIIIIIKTEKFETMTIQITLKILNQKFFTKGQVTPFFGNKNVPLGHFLSVITSVLSKGGFRLSPVSPFFSCFWNDGLYL